MLHYVLKFHLLFPMRKSTNISIFFLQPFPLMQGRCFWNSAVPPLNCPLHPHSCGCIPSCHPPYNSSTSSSASPSYSAQATPYPSPFSQLILLSPHHISKLAEPSLLDLSRYLCELGSSSHIFIPDPICPRYSSHPPKHSHFSNIHFLF